MKKAMITIVSIRKDGDDIDTTEIVTEGGYTYLPDGCELTYTETEATGFEGSSTVVRVKSENKSSDNEFCAFCNAKDGSDFGFAQTDKNFNLCERHGHKNNKRLEMQRSGSANTELLVEEGKKNYCMYGTPYGDLTVGLLGKRVEAAVDESGGKITAEYVMDINSSFAGDFSLNIEVKAIS